MLNAGVKSCQNLVKSFKWPIPTFNRSKVNEKEHIKVCTVRRPIICHQIFFWVVPNFKLTPVKTTWVRSDNLHSFTFICTQMLRQNRTKSIGFYSTRILRYWEVGWRLYVKSRG